MGREYTLFDLAGMGHHGYRARRLITLAAGFDDFGMFWWSLSLCYGRSIFSHLGVEISMSIHFIYRLALVYVDIALQRRASLCKCCR
jgi:hypothetical protein